VAAAACRLRRALVILPAAAVALIAAAGRVAAEEFPAHPVRIIVPNPPGGGFDLVGRLFAQELPATLGVQVVVENRSGAGTLVGTEAAARSPADGYTLLVGGMSNLAANVGLYRSLPYDPVADFVPLVIAVSYSYALVGRKDLPFAQLQDIVDAARARPGKLSYASGGVGTGQHITMAILCHLAGLDMIHVPYRGAAAAYQDLLAGRVDLFFDNAGTARPYVESGQVRGYAVSSLARSASLPQLPTVAETGLAKLDSETWFGLFAPARTPAAAVERLRAAAAAAAASPALVKRLEGNGGRLLRMTPAEMSAFVKREADRWSALIRAGGVSAE